MYKIIKTEYYEKWFNGLKDKRAKARINLRIQHIEMGSLGDVKPVGQNVYEARIHYGTGYRLYFCKQENIVVIMLLGGDKTTQSKDIETAKEIKKCLK